MNHKSAKEIVEFAEKVSSLASGLMVQLNSSLTVEELDAIKLPVGKVLGEVYFLTEPVLREHQDLKIIYISEKTSGPSSCQI
jgi:hypothetical protein